MEVGEVSEPMKRSGTADLPLHGGRVPQWLATRMTEFGTAIAEQVIRECAKLWAGLIFGDEMDNQAGI
jgi:hypothetical protein